MQLALTVILVGMFFTMRAQASTGIRPDLMANTAIIGGILLGATELVSACEASSQGNTAGFVYSLILAAVSFLTVAVSTKLYHRTATAELSH